LTNPNTSCTIEMPASLRSDGVRVHPGMPFGFPSESAFGFAGILNQTTKYVIALHSEAACEFGTGSEGLEHTVEVATASVYEAAVLALAEFRRCGFARAAFGRATRLTVHVKQPETEHTASVGKLQSWLDGGARARMSRF
jgi:hypothetical protein